MASGKRNIVAISYLKESAYGTANTTKLIAFPYSGELPTLDPQFAFLKDMIFGKFGQLGGELVNISGHWSPTFVMNPSNAAIFLKYALGSLAKATHAGETIVFDSTITEGTTDTDSFTIISKSDVSQLKWTGAKVIGLRIEARPDGFWNIIPNIRLQGVVATDVTSLPAIKNEDNFIWGDASLTLGGVDISSTVRGNFSLSIGLESDQANEFGMGAINQVSDEMHDRSISGQFAVAYANDTTINLINAKNQASQALVLALTGKSVPSSVVPTPYAVTITVPAIILTKSASAGGKKKLLVPYSWEAIYDTTTSKNISAVVVSNTDYTA